MGADYYFYTEALIDDFKGETKWFSIDPLLTHVDKGVVKYLPVETYWDGSRSYFSNTWNKLLTIMSPIPLSSLSDFQSYVDVMSEYIEQEDIENMDTPLLYSFYYDDLKDIVPNDNQYTRGMYIPKYLKYLYDEGDIEELMYRSEEEALTPKEYAQCASKNESIRDVFVYVEFDEPSSWQAGIKNLNKHIRNRIEDFESCNYWKYDVIKYRIIAHLSV